jgi:hypothetical protein
MTDSFRRHPNYFRPVSPGRPVRASEHNHILEALNYSSSGVASPRQLSNREDNPEGASFFQRFKIDAIKGDYLVCLPWDGTTSTTTINGVVIQERFLVARPHLLQTKLLSHNGITFVYTADQTRTASDGVNPDETQVIVPAYAEEDEIVAMRNLTGGTGVVSAGGQEVEWFDLNTDARAWAKEAS